MSNRAIVCVALCVGLAAPALGEVPPDEPRAVIEQTAAEVIQILGQKQLSVAQRRSQIEDIALQRFDFETMAKLVLKRDWRQLDAKQRNEFVVEFRDYLSASYGTRIERYQQEKVEVSGERKESFGDVTVLTRIVGGQQDGVAVDYRLRNGDQGWKIIDVVIEGVSLVQNFRSQFGEILTQGGPKELLARLKQKNAEARSGGGADANASGTTSAGS